MKVTTTTFDRLLPDHLATWHEWQRQDPALASPFFHPEFVRLAASVRTNVEIALVEDGGDLVGILPFMRMGDVGLPVAAPMNDFQGLLARPGFTCDVKELVRGCGLAAMRFDHLLASQSSFAKYHFRQAPSPFLDLSNGFAAYEKSRLAAGCVEMGQARHKVRKIVNQLGPLRFRFHVDDEVAFRLLLEWKSRQYRQTRTIDLFASPWIVDFLDRLRRIQGAEFCGVLSALCAGDRVIAIHLGMRCRQVLHSWFPAYDRDFARYSPGTVLFAEMAKAAPDQGIHCIDLGKGPEKFKVGLMSGWVPVAEASIECGLAAWLLERSRRGGKTLAAAPIVGAPLRGFAGATRALRQRALFR